MSKLTKYTSEDYHNFFEGNLSTIDTELYNAINLELQRQQEHIELIASENIVSKAVLDAQGSIMTNKYAEGYSSKRYEPTLFAISLNFLKSIILEYALPPAIISLGLLSFANSSTFS